MKRLSRYLLLVLGLSASAATAQKADSVIVIYGNQKTVIPVPAFGSQASVSYADSNHVIEIGVWHRNPGEVSLFPLNFSNNPAKVKPKNKSKWFSQLEVGYTVSVPYYDSHYSYREVGDFHGYTLGLSVREKERSINSKMAFVSGFKLGYDQSFRTVDVREIGNSAVYRSSFYKVLFSLGLKYRFTAFGLPANVSVGANLLFGYSFITRKSNQNIDKEYDNGLFFIEPYLGFEINKLGLRLASSRSLAPEMSFYNPIKSINSISLTYRLF
jgi:hypothetical protein